MPEITCRYFPACRGCDHWDQSYEQQKNFKLSYLKQLLNVSDETLNNNNYVSIKPYGLRHRFDFTIESQGNHHVMGLYATEKKLIDIQECLQLSPELQKIYNEFRAIPMRTEKEFIRKASVRLRFSPEGKKGCWLDMANVDIKALLDDSIYLTALLRAGFEVEVGQKGKKLGAVNDHLKLVDPQPLTWFQSGVFSLKCLISDFTQPSWLTGNALVEVVLNWIQDQSIKSAIEFGPGVGQFTLPLLNQGVQVHAFENNPKAIEVLQLNARDHKLEKNLSIFAGDFQNKSARINQTYDLAFVNPPRSGLKNFVNTVAETKAQYCIYVSCFPESMQIDLQKLKEFGYEIKNIKIVDQFPQTKHFESCVLLEKLF